MKIEIKDCEYCNGTGKALGHDCPLCHGKNTADKWISDIIDDLRIEVGTDIDKSTMDWLCYILLDILEGRLRVK